MNTKLLVQTATLAGGLFLVAVLGTAFEPQTGRLLVSTIGAIAYVMFYVANFRV